MLALYVGGMGARGKNFYNDLACRFGFEAEAKVIQDLYLDGRKDEAAAAVPEGLLEAATICGPEGYVRERIAAFQEVGVTSLTVTPIGEDLPALVSKLGECATPDGTALGAAPDHSPPPGWQALPGRRGRARRYGAACEDRLGLVDEALHELGGRDDRG